MSNTVYYKTEEIREGYRIVLEFPEKTEKGNAARQEVKSVLVGVLQEQLEKTDFQRWGEGDV